MPEAVNQSNGSSSVAAEKCLPCDNLYAPNPDIAGQAIFISFLVHTCIFIFLAMILNPIIAIYLRAAAPDMHDGQPEEFEGLEPASQAAEEGVGPGGRRARYAFISACREVIRDTYTSQYIAGLAFIVTAFVKYKEISIYHLRVIYSIVSMHSCIGIIANYDRPSFLSLAASRQLGRSRKMKWTFKMIDFAFLLNLALWVSFAIFVYVESQKDHCFHSCYTRDRGTFFGSTFAFGALLAIAMYGNGDHGPIGWIIFTLCLVGFVAFQNWQYESLATVFRPTTLDPGMSSEKVFSFGQILVLFMIFPLIAEYVAALIVDLRRIRRSIVPGTPPAATMLNLIKVLLPWFISTVQSDFTNAAIGLWRREVWVSLWERTRDAASSTSARIRRLSRTKREQSGAISAPLSDDTSSG